MTSSRNPRRSFRAPRFVAAFLLFLYVPSAGLAASAATLLDVRDSQSVSRAAFLSAAVKAAVLPSPGRGDVPYDDVPADLLDAVRAAHARGALKAFSKEGRRVNFRRTITRGEAIVLLSDILQATPLATTKEAERYRDARTSAERSAVQIALERNWMKPRSPSMFGMRTALRGKEAKLLLSRAFQPGVPTPNTDTLSNPVIRIKLQNGAGVRQSVPKVDMLEEVWNILRQNYLYEDRLQPDAAGEDAIEGLVNSLSDPYTTYMPKSKNEDFQLQMKGEVEGIGATVEMTGGILTIVTPLRGSPAEKAGLKPKDKILSVDGDTLQGLTLDDAVRKVRGPRGSKATLRIRRDAEEFDVTVTREKVTIPEVEISYDRNVAIVKILQFWDTTDKKFREAMAEVQTKNPRGIILDLRNNPGGLLHAAGVVVGVFVPKGSTYARIHERDITRDEQTEEDPVIKESTPLIILVNKGSASASEIVASALQAAGRARVVGETTYGKGTVQQVVQFTDGSSLKYTIAEWKDQKDRKIDKIGVKPDVVVQNDNGKDLQLEKAFELLQ